MQIISQGAAVPVAGVEDLSAALAYGNHSSSARFSPHTLEKIVEDVSHGRSFVFPREVADKIPGIRISPLTVAESTSKVRIRHDLTNANSGRSVNENTDGKDCFSRTSKSDTRSGPWCRYFFSVF